MRVTENVTVVVEQLAAKVQSLERQIQSQSEVSPTVINTINNVANTTVNNVTNVEIRPWGSPLQLTDADVEAALASIPGVAGVPALPEVVAALMELVKRAHAAAAARNVHLNPKRTDQALALTAGGWAALPLEEATAALFDGASASMAAARAPGAHRLVRTSIPVQYRAERAASVALGLRPMGAHLLNVAPGGPGPLLLEAPVAERAAPPAAAPPAPAATVAERVAAVLKTHPIRCGPSGALLVDWIITASQAAALSAQELYAALLGCETEAAQGAVRAAARAARIYADEKAQPRQ